MRVQKALFTRVEASAPWGVRSPADDGFKFALLVRGSCVLTTPASEAPVTLRSGDVFIALDGGAYETYDAPGSALLDCAEVLARQIDDKIVIGGGGAASTFISGCFEIDARDAAPLMSVLPSLLLLRAGEESNRAIEDLLGMLARETARRDMGSDAMIARIFELLFIHAVRAYCEQQALPRTGWLAVTSDPHLRHAARAIHSDLANEWTLESLAKIAGMSRSAFAARFKEKAGQTALDYLIRWRMHKAAQLIRRGELSLHEIANCIGYRSEAAFNRMFKREVGTTPGQFKRESRIAPRSPQPSSTLNRPDTPAVSTSASSGSSGSRRLDNRHHDS